MNGKPKAGLELDWKGGWETGGDSGRAVVAGDPEKSLLIKAVRYTDPDLQMPPNGAKLSPAQLADLVNWVRMGAPDPRLTRPVYETSEPKGQGKEHWAFRPVHKPAVPSVRDIGWVKNNVDNFVLAKLEAAEIQPNRAADKSTLLRRVYFDLIGLPPAPEDLKQFLADDSAQAFEKVVDKLLESPQYGERWGRHWLDVSRYSDSKGQSNRRRESSVYPYAWTYRDYVVRAFNEDKPYDRFILEQLAADRMNLGTNRASLAALGFLTLGDHFNGNPHEMINDRIDVTTKAFLGLTVACARCHDHKFDPIPQADYYSLYGVFASSVEPAAAPEILDSSGNSNWQDYLEKRQALDARLLNMRTQAMATVFGEYQRLAGVYLFATQLPSGAREAYLLKSGADTNVLKNWQQVTRGGGRLAASVFGLWSALARIPEPRFAQQAPRVLARMSQLPGKPQLSPFVLEAFRGKNPRTLAEVAVLYGNLFASPEPACQTTLAALLSDAMVRLLPNRQRGQFFALREQSDLLEMSHPGAPARAHVLFDSPNPKDSPIFIRGEAENHGPVVPRRFLEVLSPPSRPVFRNGSGRADLAQAIASTNNPLTARVWVNRVWQHHFGEGFVPTPDDLGNQSSPPTHPELLDFLSAWFMEQGWSTKKLHKLIVLSAAYQESSEINPSAAGKDPFNQLIWRARVRRLEFEPLRDSMLSFAGDLDLTPGGHPVDLSEGKHPPRRRGRAVFNPGRDARAGNARRSIYGYVDRSDLLEEMNTFDFANPSVPTGKRYETIVPQQALYLMNSRFAFEQARRVVTRDDFKNQFSPRDKVRFLYTLFFQRDPTEEETDAGLGFVQSLRSSGAGNEPGGLEGAAPDARSASAPESANARVKAGAKPLRNRGQPLGPWQEYAHALLLSNEASFVK